jgi:hypothetical protein
LFPAAACGRGLLRRVLLLRVRETLRGEGEDGRGAQVLVAELIGSGERRPNSRAPNSPTALSSVKLGMGHPAKLLKFFPCTVTRITVEARSGSFSLLTTPTASLSTPKPRR